MCVRRLTETWMPGTVPAPGVALALKTTREARYEKERMAPHAFYRKQKV